DLIPIPTPIALAELSTTVKRKRQCIVEARFLHTFE
ncbi:MAG: hypothetical protein ACI9OI_001041, partial [Chitinophagales bacterium]